MLVKAFESKAADSKCETSVSSLCRVSCKEHIRSYHRGELSAADAGRKLHMACMVRHHLIESPSGSAQSPPSL